LMKGIFCVYFITCLWYYTRCGLGEEEIPIYDCCSNSKSNRDKPWLPRTGEGKKKRVNNTVNIHKLNLLIRLKLLRLYIKLATNVTTSQVTSMITMHSSPRHTTRLTVAETRFLRSRGWMNGINTC
jgi:hypothetical protein